MMTAFGREEKKKKKEKKSEISDSQSLFSKQVSKTIQPMMTLSAHNGFTTHVLSPGAPRFSIAPAALGLITTAGAFLAELR